ncbi:unnamed protein product [Boreogadus saida]
MSLVWPDRVQRTQMALQRPLGEQPCDGLWKPVLLRLPDQVSWAEQLVGGGTLHLEEDHDSTFQRALDLLRLKCCEGQINGASSQLKSWLYWGFIAGLWIISYIHRTLLCHRLSHKGSS